MRTVEPLGSREVLIEGRRFLSFATNDYLDLAGHPRVLEAAVRAVRRYGAGARSSRLVAGSTPLHEELEEAIARFTGCEAALAFATGYMANVGTIASLVGPADRIFSDALNHASIIDGCRLSRARVAVYPTCDTERLRSLLEEPCGGRKLIISESVFSMDGTIAPVAAISRLARSHGAAFLLDDAHAIGVLGATGRGVLEHLSLSAEAVDVKIGTLGKALASMGGFAAASSELIEYLCNRARTFIYATALAPSCCAAALAALEVLEGEPERVGDLRRLCAYAAEGLGAAGLEVTWSGTAIIPVILGDNETTLAVAAELMSDGIFAPAIRPPTVPENRSRIRLSISAAHTPDDIDRLTDSLRRACRHKTRGSEVAT